MTQRDTVLATLKHGISACQIQSIPFDGNTFPAPICGALFLSNRIPRYAARILELRQAGHRIDTTGTCPAHKTAVYLLRSHHD